MNKSDRISGVYEYIDRSLNLHRERGKTELFRLHVTEQNAEILLEALTCLEQAYHEIEPLENLARRGSSQEKDKDAKDSTQKTKEEVMEKHIRFKKRPLLTSGVYGIDDKGIIVLINSRLSAKAESITIWHEVLHAMGVTDEETAEHIAKKLAEVVDAGELITYANAQSSAAPRSGVS